MSEPINHRVEAVTEAVFKTVYSERMYNAIRDELSKANAERDEAARLSHQYRNERDEALIKLRLHAGDVKSLDNELTNREQLIAEQDEELAALRAKLAAAEKRADDMQGKCDQIDYLISDPLTNEWVLREHIRDVLGRGEGGK